MTHSDHRVCNTRTLRALNASAVRNEFNRALGDEFMETEVDPDGIHVLGLALWGHNADTAPILHHRADVLIKIRDTDIPVRAFLDVSDEDWQALMTPDEAKAAQSVGGL